ncbi:hypothetical protein E3J61_02490 [Candidatus Dependentiae bacterium]|nr:MAG: hypothetical protein E3J61_02490 [Candidatus Dependentiae bacterium]
MLGLLASSLSFTAFPMEQEAPTIAEPAKADRNGRVVQTIDKVMDKLKHIKQCLQGKETCSKTDFAVLAGSLLFLRGVFYAVAHSIEPTFGDYGKYGLITTPALLVDPGKWPEKAQWKYRHWKGERRERERERIAEEEFQRRMQQSQQKRQGR